MLTGIRNALILHNPNAGKHKLRQRDLEIAQKDLGEAGIDAELQSTTGPGSTTHLARLAVAEGRQLLVVCGGDGTINEAVNGLAGSSLPLAVLPAGTGNVLAKELALPLSIPAAAKLIPNSVMRRISLGVAVPLDSTQNSRYFLCVGGAGPDGALIYGHDVALKRRIGMLAYWQEGLRQLFTYSFPMFRVMTAVTETIATMVVVGRTKHYGGPFRITTGASLFEESFELAVLTTRSRLRYLMYLVMLWMGLLQRMRNIHFWKANAVRCQPISDEKVYAQVDGEAAGRLPIEFRIVPDALTLVVPRSLSPRGSRSSLLHPSI